MGTAGVLAERYRVDGQAGAGGMGTVLRAWDLEKGCPVALKLMHAGASPRRTGREVAALRALDSDAVVRYLGTGVTAAHEAFLVMEWLEGVDLRSRIEAGALSPADTVALGRRLARGLSAIHAQGLLHRDLKPANVVLVDGQVERATIVDLGLARALEGASALTRTGATVGTIGYMAPEQARGRRDLTPACDLFALGCVLYEALSGTPAFRGGTAVAVLFELVHEDPFPLGHLVPDVPQDLAALIEQLLHKAPESRPARADAIVEALDLISAGGSTEAPRRPLRVGERRLETVLLASPEVPGATTSTVAFSSALVETALSVLTRWEADSVEVVGESLVARFGNDGETVERISRAANCALALREVAAPLRVALVLGRVDTESGVQLAHTIDHAARLLSETEAGSIRIDSASVPYIERGFRVRSEGKMTFLEGKRRRGGTRPILGREIPCVGRRRELAFLRAALDGVVEDDEVAAVQVVGEAGLGKSRVLREVLEDAGRWTRVLGASATPLSRDEAEAVARGIVLSGFSGDLTPADFEPRLRELGVADAPRAALFLAERFGVPGQRPTEALRIARQQGHVMAENVREAFVGWLSAEARHAPTLIWIDDAQWADPRSLALIAEALDSAGRGMALAICRPPGEPVVRRTWARLHPETYRLRPLADRAAEQFVRAALDGQAGEHVERLVQ